MFTLALVVAELSWFGRSTIVRFTSNGTPNQPPTHNQGTKCLTDWTKHSSSVALRYYELFMTISPKLVCLQCKQDQKNAPICASALHNSTSSHRIMLRCWYIVVLIISKLSVKKYPEYLNNSSAGKQYNEGKKTHRGTLSFCNTINNDRIMQCFR